MHAVKLRHLTLLVVLLAACGEGDGPPGENSQHPLLAVCDYSRMRIPITCTEYRNITDGDWPTISEGCDTQSTGFASILTENGACSTKNTRGACREFAAHGTTTTRWYYNCTGAFGEFYCDKQPSEVQADCQAGGGTYIPPDEAG